MKNLTEWEEIRKLADFAVRQEYLEISHETMWLFGSIEKAMDSVLTILVKANNQVYKSRLSQRKAWLEREKRCGYNQAIIKASFRDCRGKSQHRFPYLFRDAIFIPVDGPSSNTDVMWFNLFHVRECRKWRSDSMATVLTMIDYTEWLVPRNYRCLREQMEEAILAYLAFMDVLRRMDFTAKPLYHAESNFDLNFLNQCYYRVLKKENKYDPEKLLLSMAERASNGNKTPRWVLDQRKS